MKGLKCRVSFLINLSDSKVELHHVDSISLHPNWCKSDMASFYVKVVLKFGCMQCCFNPFPCFELKIQLQARSLECKQLWVKELREVIQNFQFGTLRERSKDKYLFPNNKNHVEL